MLQEWLKSIGLAHLAQAFEAHHVEHADLNELTEADLRELGLTIGERKRFRRALAATSGALGSAERRPLAVAFFDLVDSSRLSEELEGEDMVELLRAYREQCAAAIGRFDGHLAHLLGDGVLACFGYPEAHENDSERAVRAALEVAAAVRRLETPAKRPLAVRCGVATGRVVVTELLSSRRGEGHAFTGSVANLAARLQVLAPPNGVVVSESTALRVRHLFDLEDMGEQRLKGFANPPRVFRVRSRRVRPNAAEDADDPDASGLTPFVGRSEELERLRRLWRETLETGGRATLIRGEPGIGKSRLVGRFIQSLRGEAAPRLMRAQASALDSHSPLRPFLDYVGERLAAPEGALDPEAVAALTAPGSLDQSDAPPREVGDAATPEQRAAALRRLAEHFVEEARRRPSLLVVEDAHWLDPSSRELLALVIEAARRGPLMVVVTSRQPLDQTAPEVDPALVHETPLAPLERDAVRRMVRAMLGDQAAPSEVLFRIEERADGVPLFVEELLRPLLRADANARRGHAPTQESRPAAVPETLQEALAAHLDQLGAAKEVAQVAAVLGRSVDLPMLARVMRRAEERVARDLDALCEAGILGPEPGSGGGRRVFTHALLRDAAYDSLLRQQRQRLHASAAEALQALDSRFSAERPDILAWHLTEGGRAADALPYWLAAGRSAATRSALHEARHALERGAEIAAALPDSPATIETRLEFASLLGPVLFALCGPGSPESRSVYAGAVALAEAASEGGPHFAVLWGWWRLSRDFRVKAERARMLLRLARKRGEAEMLLQAHHCNWASAFHAGDFDASRRHIEEGFKIYERAECGHRPWLFGNHDAKVCAHGELAQVLWMQGRLSDAQAHERKALGWAEGLEHAGTRAHACDLALLHRYYRRDVIGVRRFAERMIALAEDRGMTENRARGRLFLGWALAEQGDPEAGLRIFEEGYRRQRATGTDEDSPIYACMFAEILNRRGDHGRALHDLHEVRGELERLGICNWIPEIWRLIGESALLAAPGAIEPAREAFEAAARVASAQGVAMLEMRAALSRAALPEGAGARRARADLARLRAAIGRDEDCAEVRRADRLLQNLGAGWRAAGEACR